MSEAKRVSFMTIDSGEDFPKKSEKDASSGKKKTFRMEVEIFEPDEFKFPDYNYKRLVLIEKVKKSSANILHFIFFSESLCVMRGGDMIERQERKRRTIFTAAVVPFILLSLICTYNFDFYYDIFFNDDF